MSGSAGRAFDGDFNGGTADCNGNDGGREQKKGGFSGHKNGASKSKKAMPFPLRKLQRFFTRSSSISCPSSCSVSHKNSNLSSGKTRFSNGLCCCLFLSSPQMLVENPNGGSTAPSVSSYGRLRSMIEANDFYSNGCNTHLPN